MTKHPSLVETISEGLAAQRADPEAAAVSARFLEATARYKYSYRFSWLGRPIIQLPQDIVAMQELVWRVQPDLIIETGVAHGGSLILSASLLELLAVCGGPTDGHVVGIDIDIRPHNREAIQSHPLARRISLLEGSSVDPTVVQRVRTIAAEKRRVMVCLDSNHTHDHVLAELQSYAPLVSVGSYCIVFDTIIEDLPGPFPGRSWGPGNSPKSAVHAFLKANSKFVVDGEIQAALLATVAPDGYLLRVSL